jgi:hypothetical protein
MTKREHFSRNLNTLHAMIGHESMEAYLHARLEADTIRQKLLALVSYCDDFGPTLLREFDTTAARTAIAALEPR